jgi:hypothetical protein
MMFNVKLAAAVLSLDVLVRSDKITMLSGSDGQRARGNIYHPDGFDRNGIKLKGNLNYTSFIPCLDVPSLQNAVTLVYLSEWPCAGRR